MSVQVRSCTGRVVLLGIAAAVVTKGASFHEDFARGRAEKHRKLMELRFAARRDAGAGVGSRALAKRSALGAGQLRGYIHTEEGGPYGSDYRFEADPALQYPRFPARCGRCSRPLVH